ncbi:hypothetical protein V6C53_11170 [Desulfocurvibacter africanus]|uniref:hypothetical protein n=1 Tax=Desulfocurvibacter africanus TaxID=873 RepID=UPI002FDB7C73
MALGQGSQQRVLNDISAIGTHVINYFRERTSATAMLRASTPWCRPMPTRSRS